MNHTNEFSPKDLMECLRQIPQNFKDNEIKIRALVQVIPYLGGMLETLIFSGKDKMEIMQIWEFISKLSEDFEKN